MTRRQFIRYALECTAVAVVVYGAGKLPASALLIRPPGAVREADLIRKCIKCGACAAACPTGTIRQRDICLDIKTIATPLIAPAKSGGCVAWKNGCRRCMEVCPTGALVPIDFERFRLARLVMSKVEACNNCMACFQRCSIPGAVLFPNPSGGAPYRDEQSIPTFLKHKDSPVKPYFDHEVCVGCGECVGACPARILDLEFLPRE